MKATSRLMLALVTALGLAGCRAAEMNAIPRNRPLPARASEPTAFRLDDFVTEHNRNAELIKSLEARPSITATWGTADDRNSGQVDGRLAIERPRNFKLEIERSLGTDIANIGSNDERFWFWLQNKNDKSVYVCDYADLESSTLSISYQPDWIVEAMGLREITAEETRRIKVRPGSEPGTTMLVFGPTKAGAQAYSRVLIVSEKTGRLSEFRVFGADGRTLLAQSIIKKYREIPLSEDSRSDESAAGKAMCYIPENIILDWKKEKFSLDVAVKDVKLNQFNPSRRTALFVEPTPRGYTRRNLAELTRPSDAENSTSIRETLPVPEPRNRVRLSPPLEIRDEKTSRASATRTERTASSMAPTPFPVLNIEEPITAPIPTAPGQDAASGARLTATPGASLER